MKRQRLILACIAIFAAIICTSAVAQRADELYLAGVQAFRLGNHEQADRLFSKIIFQHPESRFASDAVFKVAEIHFRAKQYEKAGSYYRLYIERFSMGKNVDDAKMRLAQCETESGKRIGVAHPRMEIERPALKAVRVVSFYQPSIQRLERDIAGYKNQGVNTMIVPSFYLSGQEPHRLTVKGSKPGAWYMTDQTSVTTNILPRLAAILHKYGMSLIVEFPVRSLPCGPRDLAWDPVAQSKTPSKHMNLFSDQAVESAVKALSDLAKISIDGILLTDFLQEPTDGFSTEAEAAYVQATGQAMNFSSFFKDVVVGSPGAVRYELDPAYAEISQLKADRLVKIGITLCETIRKANPNLPVWVELTKVGDIERELAPERTSQFPEAIVNMPISGVFLEVDLQNISRSAALTPDKLSVLIDRLLRGAIAFARSSDRVILGLNLKDPILKKSAPMWQVEAASKAAKRVGVENVSVAPLMSGFDYRNVLEASLWPAMKAERGEKN